MVRGFWGDIVNSPYLSYGLELETRDEITYFYANNKIDYLRDSQDVTEYNLVKFLLRMDHDEKYDFMKREKEKERLRKERIKKEEEEQEKKEKEEEERKKKEEEKKKKKLKPIAEEEDEEGVICTDPVDYKKEKEKKEKVKKEKEKKEKEEKEKKDEGIIIGKDEGIKEMTEKIAKSVDKKSLGDTTEESLIKSIQNDQSYDTNELIQAFREVKFKIYLIGGDIEKNIYKKKKFKNYFDIILYGFHAKSKFNEMQKSVLKPTSRLLFELNSYMASFEEKTRKEYRENLVKMCKNNGFILDDTSLKYLYQFKVKQETQEPQDENSNNDETINTNETSNTEINTSSA